MKKYLICVLFFLAFLLCQADASESITNQWGFATNHVQIAINLTCNQRQLKTNEPFSLMFHVKNASTNEAFWFFWSAVANQSISFSFIIVTPSGKASTLKVSPPGARLDAIVFTTINPNQTAEFELKLSELRKFDEVGTYKIIAKIGMSLVGSSNEFEVISSPLSLTVVPGEWVPPPISPSPPKRPMTETGGGPVLKGFISTIPKTNQ